VLGRILRSFWIAWFQPQHQHLLSPDNLARLLRESGFEPLDWRRGQAHMSGDFMFAATYQVNLLAGGPLDVPWRPRRGLPGRVRHAVARVVGTPWVMLGVVADLLVAPIARHGRGSNAYRVVARRVGVPSGEAP